MLLAFRELVGAARRRVRIGRQHFMTIHTTARTRAVSYRRQTISIDFDGTLMPDAESIWRYDPAELDAQLIRECQARGYAVAISTCANVDQVAQVLLARGIRCTVDRTLSRWSWHDGEVVLVTNRKVHALVMLDDHGMTYRYGDDITRVLSDIERRRGYHYCPDPVIRHHRGPSGAAGVLPWTIRRGKLHLALAERSGVVQRGRRYSTVGGAIDHGETALQAALRECREEVRGLDRVMTGDPYTAPCQAGCGWSYVTFPAEVRRTGTALPRIGVNREHGWGTRSFRWYPADSLPGELHPAFASAWPELRHRIETSTRA